ncbi:ketimine reductase mu-crystallin-like isoform X2 [Mya arenaria]|uniref:ketimine reductase mu-crystallin-like isoform X2 n=1 Tax=Mya arenaria TaxID=6604 RepID=UPI0022E5BFB0|nr:ketimine reductase mu-crystallin-like isoform X2 [Mya arenaria]XP_052759989.1 ketimine reductase mu-crystallin-like isoform X2 [Mya arenaria]XP_052759996.1 ketimine reductase mu-crystallin-like isoform X2 [Mya arenaria]XP_052821257.1 ketimine reductase mu-crystallin-like isoform X2 [Mya arenaria]XP_052821264.1 ketimine reductase mu-crystallin-like isoform X2 [Mya arenaria]
MWAFLDLAFLITGNFWYPGLFGNWADLTQIHCVFFGSMPSLCEEKEILGTKLVTFYPNNFTRHGRATHNAIIVLFHKNTGIPKAIMDGEVVTAMRTAAASAVATKYLAGSGSASLAILGAGVQARTHFHALSQVLNITQVKVWSRTFENAEKVAMETGGVACKTAEEAVKDADVIITVTGATTPVLQAAWVKPGAHINAVGACRYDWCELDPELTRSAVLYVDSREAALKESGDVILSKADVYAEIGEVILGQMEAKKNELTIFKSLGISIEDTMAGELVLQMMAEQST